MIACPRRIPLKQRGFYINMQWFPALISARKPLLLVASIISAAMSIFDGVSCRHAIWRGLRSCSLTSIVGLMHFRNKSARETYFVICFTLRAFGLLFLDLFLFLLHSRDMIFNAAFVTCSSSSSSIQSTGCLRLLFTFSTFREPNNLLASSRFHCLYLRHSGRWNILCNVWVIWRRVY